jgi:hypothetical protein
MTPRTWEAWPAQKPGGEFAAKTVAAILRDRGAARGRRRKARWWAAIGIAAVLVATGAPSVSPSPRRTREPAPVPPAGHTAKVPVCNCTGAICDCGEEP